MLSTHNSRDSQGELQVLSSPLKNNPPRATFSEELRARFSNAQGSHSRGPTFPKRSAHWIQSRVRIQVPVSSWGQRLWVCTAPSTMGPAHWDQAIPCSESKPSPGKAEPRSMLPLLCKPQEDSQVQLGQGIHPARSRAISVPQGSLLVEREKDLSAYNWNSFGLRYGKRQADTGEAKVKIL
uniref:KiSS-1 metastasis suppressor n=1 Tax=Terrapene triunguis TaxID=2587831 RepID=A0A674K4V3_9SAUR